MYNCLSCSDEYLQRLQALLQPWNTAGLRLSAALAFTNNCWMFRPPSYARDDANLNGDGRLKHVETIEL
jgi:hypothetical protein